MMTEPRRGLLFEEDFSQPVLGMYNDASGSAHRDTEIWFDGKPTVRLDPQGIDAGSQTVPGDTPTNSGVIFKRRIAFRPDEQRLGMDLWFRFTSRNLSGQAFLLIRVYTRDGTNYRAGSLWFDHGGSQANDLDARLHTAAGVWTSLGTVNQSHVGQHLYSPGGSSSQLDKAGSWHYAKLVVDFKTGRYVYAQLDDLILPAAERPIFESASTGARATHFSAEFFQTNTSRKFVNIAKVRGSRE